MAIQNVKGTHDIIGEEAAVYSTVENILKQTAQTFGYNEVRPPVIEHTDLFIRGVGEGSDVVRKEMYTFDDKAGRSITLRPEFTAGIIRLTVQNKLLATSELPLKQFYCGPVFRYERPQLGRYRQFIQFGVESIGHSSVINDVECISLAYNMLENIGLEGVTLKINTLGDDASRSAYKTALKEFFADKIENMCPDCKSRYELNPLRILDCKVPADQEIVKDAPKMSDFISKESRERFETILKQLEMHGINYEVDDTLVRGLDYYSETVFEFHYTSAKGMNYGAIGAGGHYDKLVKEVGGPDLPGIGFSFGVERLIAVLKDDEKISEESFNGVDVYVMPLDANSQAFGLLLANTLRSISISSDICFDNVKLGNMFKRADKKHAKVAVIVGEEEMKNQTVNIKNLQTKEQITVDIDCFVDQVIEILESLEKHHCSCGHHHDEEHECCGGHGHGHHDHECCCGEEGHECCCGHDEKGE